MSLGAFLIMSCIYFSTVSCRNRITFPISNRLFTTDLYDELTSRNEEKRENFVISPFSTQVILTAVKEGARGRTANELSEALYISSLPDVPETIRNVQLNVITNTFSLISANKVYIDDDCVIRPSYLYLLRDYFHSDIENIDFLQSGNAAYAINKWIKLYTGNAIEDVIDPSQIDRFTMMILINTLYLSGQWTTPFRQWQTRPEAFFSSNCSKPDKQVDMMNSVETYLFVNSDDLNAKFLELPYADSNVSMTFILPTKNCDMDSIEDHTERYLVRQNLQLRIVNVSIPKFTITTTTDLKPILQKLDVHALFKRSANLSGITDQPVSVSSVIQKTFIDVTESGTRAAAASAVTIGARTVPSAPEETFRADHSFVFYIRDNVSQMILFIGRYIY